jgi:hypothetical protein
MIFSEIEKALDAGLPYLAIVATLSIPDICARLELDPDRNIEGKKKHYVAWCQANFLQGGSDYMFFTGDDLYRIRCGVLHQAKPTGHRETRYKHILFIVRQPGGKLYHLNLQQAKLDLRPGWPENLAVDLDTATFCHDMISAARRWYEAKRNDPNVRANLPNVVRFRPEGYPPFRFVPLIA